MSFFKNKHVIAALIIAPILALIRFFAVDYYVSERPHQAVEGQTYSLVAKSNCRWASGHCKLENSDFKLHLQGVTHTYGSNQILLDSNTELQSVSYAVVPASGVSSQPVAMRNTDNTQQNWRSQNVNINQTDYLQLVIRSNGIQFFAEVPLVFIFKEEVYK